MPRESDAAVTFDANYRPPTSVELELIERIRLAEACLDDAEGSARVLALGLMGFDEVRKILRGIKGEMALRILMREPK